MGDATLERRTALGPSPVQLPSKERSSVCRKAFYCMPMSQEPQDVAFRARPTAVRCYRDGPNFHRKRVMNPPVAPVPLIVLDTNVVLDWLVFGNPGCAAVHTALAAGEVQWIATPAMRDELAHVLGRGRLDAWQPDLAAVWSAWDRHCNILAASPSTSAPGRLRCSDPDDQKFVDLAVGAPAHWLVSRDRAVLKLARRLLEVGVEAVAPERWSRDAAAAGVWRRDPRWRTAHAAAGSGP